MEEQKLITIFSENDEFIKSLHDLNSEKLEECMKEFKSLIEVCVSGEEKDVVKSPRRDTLSHILNKVAFYPLNPDVMQVLF